MENLLYLILGLMLAFLSSFLIVMVPAFIEFLEYRVFGKFYKKYLSELKDD